MTIADELLAKVRDWLGEDGKKFFSEIYEKYGILNAVWMEGKIPHPVHFREGMQVRNFLRSTGLCNDWNQHDLENRWEEVILKALKLT